MNKVAIRKEIGAVLYRLRTLTPEAQNVTMGIINNHVDNLYSELPVEYRPLLDSLARSVAAFDFEAVAAAIENLRGELPPQTYGEITAGTRFTVEENYAGIICTKRKLHIDHPLFGQMPHLPADTVVEVV